MKYFKTLGIYKNATNTLTFNPNTNNAFSYGWYCIAREIDGQLYVTRSLYSPTTAKHVSKLCNLLYSLGLPFERLRNTHSIEDGIIDIEYEIKKLEEKIASPKTKKAKNIERKEEIKVLKEELNILLKLKGKE